MKQHSITQRNKSKAKHKSPNAIRETVFSLCKQGSYTFAWEVVCFILRVKINTEKSTDLIVHAYTTHKYPVETKAIDGGGFYVYLATALAS